MVSDSYVITKGYKISFNFYNKIPVSKKKILVIYQFQ